jgi:hypothetical protein
VSRVGRDGGGSSRTPRHRRADLWGVGTSLAGVVRPAQTRVECAQCGRSEHPPSGRAAAGADRLRPRLGQRTHNGEIAAPATGKTVSWQRPPPETVLKERLRRDRHRPSSYRGRLRCSWDKHARRHLRIHCGQRDGVASHGHRHDRAGWPSSSTLALGGSVARPRPATRVSGSVR